MSEQPKKTTKQTPPPGWGDLLISGTLSTLSIFIESSGHPIGFLSAWLCAMLAAFFLGTTVNWIVDGDATDSDQKR